MSFREGRREYKDLHGWMILNVEMSGRCCNTSSELAPVAKIGGSVPSINGCQWLVCFLLLHTLS